jgi:hypothetical protein
MLPGNRLALALCCIAPLLISCAAVPCAQAKAPSSEPVFVAEGLGLGTVALDGPWQFHLGDDIARANPDLDDAAGQNGWERIDFTAIWPHHPFLTATDSTTSPITSSE